MIIADRFGARAVFHYGFSKKERDNIGPDELTELRIAGQNWLLASAQTITEAVEQGMLQEVGPWQAQKS